MIPLTILLISGDPARARAALTLAVSHAALGGETRLFAHERAVAMLAPFPPDPDGGLLHQAGLPDRVQLLAMAREAGVALVACQTGLAMSGIGVEALAPGIEAGGLMALMATLGDGRVVTI